MRFWLRFPVWKPFGSIAALCRMHASCDQFSSLPTQIPGVRPMTPKPVFLVMFYRFLTSLLVAFSLFGTLVWFHSSSENIFKLTKIWIGDVRVFNPDRDAALYTADVVVVYSFSLCFSVFGEDESDSCFGYHSHFCPFYDLLHVSLIIVVQIFFFFFLRAPFRVSEEAKNHQGSFLLKTPLIRNHIRTHRNSLKHNKTEGLELPFETLTICGLK